MGVALIQGGWGISMTNLNAYWPEILDVVRKKIAQQTFNTWFVPLVPVNTESEIPEIDCPDRFFMDWFSEHHLPALNEAGTNFFGTTTQFALKVTENTPITENKPPEAQTGQAFLLVNGSTATAPTNPSPAVARVSPVQPAKAPIRTGLTTRINPEYTFDNFVVGSGTDLVFAAATAVSKNPGSHFNPLFIYGGVGLGKTHLMHAIGNAIIQENPETKICYITAENFMNDLVASIRDRKTPEFKFKYRNMDVLLVDDVAFLTGKESTQEEFFHTFNALYDLKKQIVLTSDRSPKEITTLEERLRSRFEWGLITDIQPPNLETRMAILKRKVESNRIMIPDDVITYIAENITDNIRRLEGALIRLLAFASLTGNEITLNMAAEVLSSFFRGKIIGPVKIADVMEIISEINGFSIEQLKSKRRTQDLAEARQIAMYLAREMTGASLNQIGRSFGNKDHSTVSHACRKISGMMEKDARFRGALLDIQDKIRNKK